MITETFQFFGPTFETIFLAENVTGPTPANTIFGWKSFASSHATLVRSDQENDVDLGPVVKNAFLPIIIKLLGNQHIVTLTSGPFAQIALWPQVPYFLARPLNHSLNTTLLRVDFNLHVHTPWPMSDADVNTSFYVFARLQGGHVKADVDGAWVIVNGGWPDGQAIADKFGAAAIQAIPTVQSAINTTLAPLSGATFKALYLIPGNGSKAPVLVQNATTNTTLAIVA
jgi:hypothetical protein